MLPKGHAKGKIVPIRFSPDDLMAIAKAAKAEKVSVSEWVRRTLHAKLSGGEAWN
jgi:predicted HicB family RNase H-like nuclease